MPGSNSTVRLQRSMTCLPASAAACTTSRKRGCSSGAPPVRSTVCAPVRRIAWSTWSTVASSIMASVRSGPASTWQCLQVMLQSFPRLTWKISSFAGARSGARASNSARSGTLSSSLRCAAGAASGARRRLRLFVARGLAWSCARSAATSSSRMTASRTYIPAFFACSRICMPCTRVAPPVIAAATCRASVICSRSAPFCWQSAV